MGRKCVYCGNGNLTREHVIGDWVSDVLLMPPTPIQYTSGSVNLTEGTFEDSNEETIIRAQDLLRLTVKKFCRDCNCGWMSTLQGNVKPVISKAITDGNFTNISDDDFHKISAWIAMIVISLEFTRRDGYWLTTSELLYFRKHRTPPPHWKIWIGKTEKLYKLLERESYRSEITIDEERRPLRFAARKATIVLGHLAIHVFGQSLGILTYPNLAPTWPVVQIFPPSDQSKLPSEYLLHDDLQGIYGLWRGTIPNQIQTNPHIGNSEPGDPSAFPVPLVPLNLPSD